MNRHVVRFFVIMAVGIGAGLVHGLSTGGMKMPPNVSEVIPDAPASKQATATPAPKLTDGEPDVKASPIATPAAAPAADLDPDLLKLKAHFDAGTAILVDARNREDYVAGHVPGAMHGPLGDFTGKVPDWFTALPPDQLIFVYCEGGDCDASQAVAREMVENGMSNVFVFHPGYPAWTAAGFPVTTGEEP